MTDCADSDSDYKWMDRLLKVCLTI